MVILFLAVVKKKTKKFNYRDEEDEARDECVVKAALGIGCLTTVQECQLPSFQPPPPPQK